MPAFVYGRLARIMRNNTNMPVKGLPPAGRLHGNIEGYNDLELTARRWLEGLELSISRKHQQNTNTNSVKTQPTAVPANTEINSRNTRECIPYLLL